MAKLKPRWVRTDIPKKVKIKLWRDMKDNPTYKSWEQANVGKTYTTDQDEILTEEEWKYVKVSKDTYAALRNELKLMPPKEVLSLPPDLQNWLREIREDLPGVTASQQSPVPVTESTKTAKEKPEANKQANSEQTSYEETPHEELVRETAEQSELKTSPVSSTAPDVRQSEIAHDKEIFDATDHILPERALHEFLNRVERERGYRSSGIRALQDFVEYFDSKGNQYMDRSLKNAVSNLDCALRELIEFLSVNNADGIDEGEDRFYPLFPRANPVFSLYLDVTHDGTDLTFEELTSKYQRFLEYLGNKQTETEVTAFINERLVSLYGKTDVVHPFTIWDYKKNYHGGLRDLTRLLNQTETVYRTYRAAIRGTLFV